MRLGAGLEQELDHIQVSLVTGQGQGGLQADFEITVANRLYRRAVFHQSFRDWNVTLNAR